ncbi:DUF1214 domain-containing protein [Devosia nitrariae]|uniref:DUF1214 domain-containing protein n=1 Tax=Devosia nitrariae TaxID=2071872 RepID=A0ABQ5W5I2_9HYPH|nr:DUF1214 domain-containing protein [Devosia nitrariae]GLQ55046.1 hypothetical protein GCM10010862_23050 [Devosia nitrariae]
MRFVLRLLMMFAVALAVGFGLSYYALTDGRYFGILQSGPWTAWPDAGSPAPNPYTRAHAVRAGTLPLGQAEGLQFTATTDSTGEPLIRSCGYRLDGHTPVATFWTLVAIDAGGRNVARPGTALAMRSRDIARPEDGAIRVHVGTRLMPGNWLELTGRGPFSLVLTLYDTVASSGFGADVDAMPAIVREGCR